MSNKTRKRYKARKTRQLTNTNKVGKKPKLAGIAAFLHPQNLDAKNPDNMPWRFLAHLLLIAFVIRAVVALSGDFVIHPDEIMQYLEPAHQLVFGSGVSYWEYFYGARSWIVPGIAAVAMWVCKAIGLSEPMYYIASVKLMFCAISLLIPWGMYVFCRRHWSEQTARLALIFGVFWYELAVFAHKPMTEFIATALLIVLLAVMPLSTSHWRRLAVVGALCVLIVAVRMQYAPPAALIFSVSFWIADKNGRWAMLAAAVVMTIAVGILEMATWGAPFHSYYINIMMNFIIGSYRLGESSPLLMLLWLLLASGGLIALVAFSLLSHVKRRGFVLLLVLLIVVPHMLQNHKEYRFIFATIPLWLMLFADASIIATNQRKNYAVWLRAICAFVATVSLLGVFNLIPFQNTVYAGFSSETGRVNFMHNQDPIFKIYRQLAIDESVLGLIDSGRPYFNTGGYYYFHHAVPFYDYFSWHEVGDTANPAKYASHIIVYLSAKNSEAVVLDGQTLLQTERGKIRLPAFIEDLTSHRLVYWDGIGRAHSLPNYALQGRFTDGKFGELTLWKSKDNAPVRKWKKYQVVIAYGIWAKAMRKIQQSPTPVPPKYNVEFVDAVKQ